MAEIKEDLAAPIERHGRPDVGSSMAATTRERAEVVERFPLAERPTLPLQRYALGGDGDDVPYCQLLECRTPHLGSIKGGSARKHMIFRRRDGQCWLTAPLQGLDPDAA